MPARLPLEGVRVLDLTRNVAGPYASMILAELGADVVKVEEPLTGDDSRGWGPPFWAGESPIFLSMNRNKRSLTLDLRHPEARPVMERLTAGADILLESFRPGALERMGYGYAWAALRNPDLVYCSVTPYGDRGPMRDLPGYDPLVQAHCGIMSVTGEAGGPPVRVGVSLIDMGTGMWAALACLAALRLRETEPGPRRIVVSLYETGLAWMCYHLAAYWASGEVPGRHGTGATTIVPYQAFETADGQLMIGAGNDALFARLSEVLGHPEWPSDPRFATNSQRVSNRELVSGAITEATRHRPRAELAQALRAAGVPCSEIRDSAQVAADPQALALGIFQSHPDSPLPGFRSVGLPARLDGERPPLRLHPPRPGEHSREVLAEAGFAGAELEALASSEAVTGSRQHGAGQKAKKTSLGPGGDE